MFEIAFTITFLVWMGQCFRTCEEWLTEVGFHMTAEELVPLGFPAPFPPLNGVGVACFAALILGSAGMLFLNKFRRIGLLEAIPKPCFER